MPGGGSAGPHAQGRAEARREEGTLEQALLGKSQDLGLLNQWPLQGNLGKHTWKTTRRIAMDTDEWSDWTEPVTMTCIHGPDRLGRILLPDRPSKQRISQLLSGMWAKRSRGILSLTHRPISTRYYQPNSTRCMYTTLKTVHTRPLSVAIHHPLHQQQTVIHCMK